MVVMVVIVITQQVLRVNSRAVWEKMGQSTFKTEFAIALLEVFARQLVCC